MVAKSRPRRLARPRRARGGGVRHRHPGRALGPDFAACSSRTRVAPVRARRAARLELRADGLLRCGGVDGLRARREARPTWPPDRARGARQEPAREEAVHGVRINVSRRRGRPCQAAPTPSTSGQARCRWRPAPRAARHRGGRGLACSGRPPGHRRGPRVAGASTVTRAERQAADADAWRLPTLLASSPRPSIEQRSRRPFSNTPSATPWHGTMSRVEDRHARIAVTAKRGFLGQLRRSARSRARAAARWRRARTASHSRRSRAGHEGRARPACRRGIREPGVRGRPSGTAREVARDHVPRSSRQRHRDRRHGSARDHHGQNTHGVDAGSCPRLRPLRRAARLDAVAAGGRVLASVC